MVQNKNIVDIIIPTFNNPKQLHECVQSLLGTYNLQNFRIIIVNNGDKDQILNVPDSFKDIVSVVTPGGNQGWTGGLIEGLKESNSKYVLFLNDDVFIPPASAKWLHSMVRILQNNRNLAAVGPSTNCAMGLQNIWSDCKALTQYTSFLIGFCMLVDREKLDEVGGVDVNFPTGDDVDLSIRFRDNNYLLCVDNSTFVYHHGFQTGNRVYGDHSVANGWNSPQMTKKTDLMLIRKHGFLKWWYTMVRTSDAEVDKTVKLSNQTGDSEGEIVRSYVNGSDPNKILEIGCGPTLTIEGSVGLDMVEKGYSNPHVVGKSVAHYQHDLNKGKMPIEDESYEVIIARHILEHCVDVVSVLNDIHRVLTPKGMLLVSLPDEGINDTINMNPEHVHAFTSESFVKLAELTKFEVKNISEGYNGVSFTVKLIKE